MSKTIEERLAALKERQHAADKARATEDEARRSDEARREERRETAKKLWETRCAPVIDKLLEQVNLTGKDAGFTLRREAKEPPYPAISELVIRLSIGGRGDRRTAMTVNVSALGKIQVRGGIEGASFSPSYEGDVATFDEQTFGSVILDFLERALPEMPGEHGKP